MWQIGGEQNPLRIKTHVADLSSNITWRNRGCSLHCTDFLKPLPERLSELYTLLPKQELQCLKSV